MEFFHPFLFRFHGACIKLYSLILLIQHSKQVMLQIKFRLLTYTTLCADSNIFDLFGVNLKRLSGCTGVKLGRG